MFELFNINQYSDWILGVKNSPESYRNKYREATQKPKKTVVKTIAHKPN